MNGKTIALLTILVVLTAMVATVVTIPAIADKDRGNAKDGSSSSKVEIEAHVGSESAHVHVKIGFITNAKDRDAIARELNERIRLDKDTIAGILKTEHEEHEEVDREERLDVKAKVTPADTFVKFKYEFVIDATERSAIVDGIASKLSSLRIDPNTIRVEDIKDRAEEAMKDAEAKGKKDVADALEKVMKTHGRSFMLSIIRIALTSDVEQVSGFGVANITAIKHGDGDKGRLVLRTNINLLIESEVSSLTACLDDGTSTVAIGSMRTDVNNGITVAHLKGSINLERITLPGITVKVVEGNDCRATALLSGSI
ncbi:MULTISPECIES: hypothetical protein [Candidatus Nitrosocaldus]|jgi:hypothetical protein|uniref:Uncharacterized protein n=1 Tax=Candidatus Nitrosocaldus cavascurensis TaxID=2058097 RepID=A0A2K5ARX6_9ARCH|nr:MULTISPECIES: hypothetical protein [Candidatus Nitrosocaldus]SPC34354.1 exported protein of unknown function [Candidatus Nitrosocaldus cavascurensis]